MLAKAALLKTPGLQGAIADRRMTDPVKPMSPSTTPTPSARRATFAPIRSENAAPPPPKSPTESRRSTHAPSIAGIMMARKFSKKLSQRAMEKRKEKEALKKLAPTYRMQPQKKYDSCLVEGVMKDVIDARLATMKYSPRIAAMVSRVISEEIKDKVKSLEFDRYKIVCLVTMGENKEQTLMVASRCAWDPKFDSCTTYNFKNGNVFCTATVYGLYNE